MIQNKKDYLYYLEADQIALSRNMVSNNSLKEKIHSLIFPDDIWKFQKLLRKIEFYLNYKLKYQKSPLTTLKYYYHYRRFLNLSAKLNFTIPPNTFGPGLSIAHAGTIVVNTYARIGANCRINVCVNIGTAAGYSDQAPTLGDNIYIGPGAKIFGKITIGNNNAIGANAVVNKTFLEEGILIAGIPAKKISNVNIDEILINATKNLGLTASA